MYDFLVWVASGLGATLVFSYVAERWLWFQRLSSNAKKIWSTVISTLLAGLAYVAYTYIPADVWVATAPYWQIVTAVITNNYGKEIFHNYDKELPSAVEKQDLE